MIRHQALASVCALVLLGSTALPALAHQTVAEQSGGSQRSPRTQPGALAVIRQYFDALDHQGRLGHDDQALDRLFASGVTLTESLTTGRPQLRRGLRQLRAFDRRNDLHWFVDRSQRLTPTVVMTMVQATVKGPGHELGRADPWLTVFTIRNGKIASLVWMPC